MMWTILKMTALDQRNVIILSSFTILCYANSLLCGFVFDDTSAIRDNKDLLPSSPLSNIFLNDFWGIQMSREQSHKSYRPLCVLTFKLNYLLHGLDPMGYHLVNVLLHLCVTILYYRVCCQYVRERTSFSAALLFSVHPVHTEAVTGAVGRAELLSSIFFLVTMMVFTRSSARHWLLTSMTTSLAMLSKEVGITVIGLCLVHELFIEMQLHRNIMKTLSLQGGLRVSKQSFMKMVMAILTLVSLLIFRIQLLQGSSLPVFTIFDNPASHADKISRYLTYSYLPCLNLWLLLCPSMLCCDWTMGSVPLLQSFNDIRIISMLITLSLSAAMAGKVLLIHHEKQSKRILVSVAWMIIPFIPASNIFFPVGFVIAERVLYIPSMGWCLLVSIGLHKMFKQCRKNVKRISRFLFYFLIFSHSVKTMARNFDWIDEKSIFLSGLTVNKANAKLYNNVGHALESKKSYTEALLLFKEAARVQPNDIGAHINIGRTLNFLGHYQDAEIAYRSAQKLLPTAVPGKKFVTRIAPNSLNLFLNLGNLVARNSSRLEEANNLYMKAIAMRSDYVQAYINRGDVLLRMNKSEEALQTYQEALKYDQNNADIHYNLAVVALEQKNPKLGMSYLDKALEINPNHPEALLNSAILIQELGLADMKNVAVERLLKLKESQPHNPKVFFNLAMIAADDNSIFEAEVWFRQAIQLQPDFRSALFNLALLLSDSQRPDDAIIPLEQLLLHYPDHVKGLILLADIYTNHKRDFNKAERNYKR